jgi:hypothetical protein
MISDSNTMRTKRVTFTPYVEISEFPRLDSHFKSSLYYSKAEIYEIQSRLRLAVAIRKQRRLLERLASELIWNSCSQEQQHDARKEQRERLYTSKDEEQQPMSSCCSGTNETCYPNKKARIST